MLVKLVYLCILFLYLRCEHKANIKPTRGHGFKLVQEQFETQRRLSFFCQRVVIVWNSLPVSIVNFSSFNSFKRSLQNVDLSIFTRV